jgi:hypothetical protein
MDGLLSAAGGEGGLGGCCGGGGGGGGGRVALEYRTLSLTGTIDVSGGTSNVAESSPCGCGAGIPGDPAGTDGLITKTLIPAPPTPPAPSSGGGSTIIAPVPLVKPATKASCVVPALKGKKVAAAREALTKAHCAAGRVERVFSPKGPRGRVVSATAKPGKTLANGSKVGLKVSKGVRPLTR